MSDAKALDFDGRKDPLLLATPISEGLQVPEDEQVTTPYEDMLASIGRTALYDPHSPHIHLLSPERLSEGNRRVDRARDPDEVRHLTIIGPDAIKIDDNPTIELPSARSAELLGLMIMIRQVVPSGRYKELGFVKQVSTDNGKTQAYLKAVNLLNDVSAPTDTPLITRSGKRQDAKAGIDRFTVSDLRYTSGYKEARRKNAREHFEAYLRDGGNHPGLTERPRTEGARMALQSFAGSDMDKDTLERFTQLNKEIARMLSHASDEYNEADQLDTRMSYVRGKIADEFSPEWQTRSACDSSTQGVFFIPGAFERKAEKIAREKIAKSICQSCPVMRECLSYALEKKVKHGVWGGLNEKERRRLGSS